MKELSDFERYMRKQLKKQKESEDQKILDEMLCELKKKHERNHQEKLARAKEALNLLSVEG